VGSHNLGSEGLFEDASGREFGHEFREGLGVFFVFAFEDEVALGEEALLGGWLGDCVRWHYCSLLGSCDSDSKVAEGFYISACVAS
jgi:hypothetical protein